MLAIFSYKWKLDTFVFHVGEKRKPMSLYRRFKGGDDIFDTKTLTFAITVSNFSPWVINLLFRIVERESDFKQQILALLLGHHSQLVSHKSCSHFAISWGFVYLAKQSWSLPHKESMMTKPTFNHVKEKQRELPLASMYVQPITTCVTICDYHEEKKRNPS